GRAGFDTAGEVVAQAPEHEIENARGLAKAGIDPKARRKLVKKKAPEGFVNWGEGSFERLIAAQPEVLTSSMQVTAAMLVNLLSREGGDPFEDVRALVFGNHEPIGRQRELA